MNFFARLFRTAFHNKGLTVINILGLGTDWPWRYFYWCICTLNTLTINISKMRTGFTGY